MAIGPGVGFALVVNGGILILGFLAYGYWLKTHNSETDTGELQVERWFDETLSLVQEVQQVAESSGQPADLDRLRCQLLPLANRIQGNVRTAPQGVDSHVLRSLYDLGRDCYTISMEHTTLTAVESGIFVEDKLANLRSDAQDLETVISAHHQSD